MERAFFTVLGWWESQGFLSETTIRGCECSEKIFLLSLTICSQFCSGVSQSCVDHAEPNTLQFWNVLSFDFDLARTGLVSLLLSRKAAGGSLDELFNTCAIFDNSEPHETHHD